MEGDRLLVAAGVTVAAVFGAYVLWGPSGGTRLRKRRGQIGGLHNLGRTCFLNAILQALSACSQFKLWLQHYPGRDNKSLIATITTVIDVVNGTHLTIRSDPFTPGEILRVLISLGWFIPPDEQDAHELLHVIITSLEEESLKPQKQMGSLTDALGMMEGTLISTRPSSAMNNFDGDSPWPETPDTAPQSPPYPPLSLYLRSEVHTPNSPQSPDGELDFDSQINLFEAASNSGSGRQSRPRYSTGRPLSKRSSLSCRSLERVGGMVRMSLWDEQPKEVPPPMPFRGSLASQMRCTACGHKTAVRYDKFDSITLHLLSDMTGCTLSQLLRKFVAPEIVKDFECQNCNPPQDNKADGDQEEGQGEDKNIAVNFIEGGDSLREVTLINSPTKEGGDLSRNVTSVANGAESNDSSIESSAQSTPKATKLTTCIKNIYFGKLPNILCLHISRTMWLDSGRTYKRTDYVSFSENISLTPFTYLHANANQGTSSPVATLTSGMSGSMPTSMPGSFTSHMGELRSPYRLVAVVVHVGDTSSGHFITYRRGVMRNTHKWYYTSDAVVREVSVNEVLQSVAYLLFYQKFI